LALEEAEIIECHETVDLEVVFSYIAMNDIMKVVKNMNLQIISQEFDNTCKMILRVRKDHEENARRQLGLL
jgi:putative IMPACT (imprinted ancient) family translation regulator